MDVKMAFLHGDLHKEIYMVYLKRFVKGKRTFGLQAEKSFYGLKQVPREWYHKFDAFIWSQGFKRSEIDHCLYTKRAKDNNLILLALYVDDLLLASKNTYELNALKANLHEAFDMKYLGSVGHTIGMRITSD